MKSLLFIAMLAGAAAAHAQAPGKSLYDGYCAGCHGPRGNGDGWMTEHLNRAPPRLDTLARDYGGKLPIELLRHTIDGRRQVQMHGPRDMPVWGYVFLADYQRPFAPLADEASVTRRIDALIDYLREIQE